MSCGPKLLRYRSTNNWFSIFFLHLFTKIGLGYEAIHGVCGLVDETLKSLVHVI